MLLYIVGFEAVNNPAIESKSLFITLNQAVSSKIAKCYFGKVSKQESPQFKAILPTDMPPSQSLMLIILCNRCKSFELEKNTPS